MAIWNPQPPNGVTDVEQGITNSSTQLQYDAAQGAYTAIQSALGANQIPSWADVQALSTSQNKTGLQRLYYSIGPGTTNQAVLSPFPGIGYGIWRIAITCKTSNATVTLEDQDLNSIWSYSRQVNVGSSFTLDSPLDYLWRSIPGGGVNVVKDTLSDIQVELWMDYLYA